MHDPYETYRVIKGGWADLIPRQAEPTEDRNRPASTAAARRRGRRSGRGNGFAYRSLGEIET